ncbi:PASTA domain-containing protein [Acidiferrimicrobium sp. IK]|uniref:Stk1 family PASTA domain-containing Ser/Thr kinase n=1 Tax=Acidiferrimicrobium sp. IK TaxID=2871700 RepID=UPI0021CB8A31|nr:Stk1 family PASTA domain-containing Ser/Thr kinase [Acidiferrimicrobium sp. IK]MCU4186524.1 PASTA domain-containing protein [Acidiferrimicrobium sp. IK]
MAPSRSVELVGRVLGDRYRLTRPIGTGASAHVYAADDITLRRRVAVKVLHPGLAGDEAFTRRFRAEAHAAAGLRHPHILQVYDSGEDQGTPYLVMELLEGGSLRSLLDRGQLLTPSQAARVGADVARALDYAHRHGVVHRDIKPANLLFDDEGRATVADFGLARALAAATWTEPIGGILGTARYAAPEQVRDQVLDGRADVYALALVMVEAVTGSVPFASDNTVGTVMARLERPIDPGTGLGPLAEVVAAAGTVEREGRLDAAGMADALEAAALRLPPPSRLPLVGVFERDDVERDDAPTAIPGGRPAPFDIEALEGAARPAPGAPPAPAGATGQPAAPAGALRGGPGSDPGGVAPDDTVALGARPDDTVALGARPDDTVALGARPDDTVALGARPDDTVALGARPDDTVALGAGTPAAVATVGGPAAADDDNEDGGDAPRRRRWRRWLLAVLAVVILAGGGAAAYELTRPPPSHPVPALVHLDQARAGAVLAPLHLHLAVTGRSYDPVVPAGEILTQVPSGGTLREGSTVGVTLSLGPQPIPVPAGLAGKSQADATTILTTLGLKVGTVTQSYSLTVPEGQVISSSPSSGTLLPGQPVALTVSAGKPFVTVPSLDSTFTAAQAALSALGLPASENDQFSDTVPKGQVIASSPAAGTKVRVGTGVTVVVSKGPDVVTVPSVQGASVAAAAEQLAAAGLSVTGVSGNPTAAVSGTSPAAGTVVHRGAQVTIVTG